MSETVECKAHGEQQETFVCHHLFKALDSGEKVGFFWSGEPRGDAWCSACEAVRIREGGITGDWNERSEKFADIKLLCGACYDQLRKLHGF
jgi:ferredoxin